MLLVKLLVQSNFIQFSFTKIVPNHNHCCLKAVSGNSGKFSSTLQFRKNIYNLQMGTLK